MWCLGLYGIARVGSRPTENPACFTQPIGGSFVTLDGRSLADKSKLALLSVLAIVAVNQGLCGTFPLSLSV